MKLKSSVLILMFVSLGPGASADLEVSVAQGTCPESFSPLISIPDADTTTGNPGAPAADLYRDKVCVSGVEAPEIQNSCPRQPGFYLFNEGTSAHFSNQSRFPVEVCTGRLSVQVRPDTAGGACEPTEIPLFSVSNYSDGHVAHPDSNLYPFKACGSLLPFSPDSVDVRLSFNISSADDVESDTEPIARGGEETSFDYPYIASSDGDLTAGIVSRSANTTIRRMENGYNKLILSQNGPASVYIPHTQGGFSSIRRRESDVVEREFLSKLSPAFGFAYDRGDPRVDVALTGGFDLANNISLSPGRYNLVVEKVEDGQVAVRAR